MDTMRREALLKEYGEVSNNFRLLTDIRFKLLAFLPIAAASAAAFKGDELAAGGFILSLFGLVVTLGLVTYNTRNDQLYDELVGRAASIERSLGLPDGAFANRPRSWLYIPVFNFHWSVNHGNGVSIIYMASIALWSYGVLAPVLELLIQVYQQRGLPDTAIIKISFEVKMIALILAVVLTWYGEIRIGRHRIQQSRYLKGLAKEAVEMAKKLPVSELSHNVKLMSLCVRLSGRDLKRAKSRRDIRARAKFLARLHDDSLDYYLNTGSEDMAAAHIVAYLTDFPPRWIFDIATNRREKN